MVTKPEGPEFQRLMSRMEGRKNTILEFYKKVDNIPRYLSVERSDDGSFDDVSPIFLNNELRKLSGKPKSVWKESKRLVIETISGSQSCELLCLSHLCSFPVNVSPHETLNNSIGAIFCRDLLNCSLEEIEEDLKEQGVNHVRHVTTWKNGKEVNTGHLVLGFRHNQVPKQVEVGFYSLDVLPIQDQEDIVRLSMSADCNENHGKINCRQLSR